MRGLFTAFLIFVCLVFFATCAMLLSARPCAERASTILSGHVRAPSIHKSPGALSSSTCFRGLACSFPGLFLYEGVSIDDMVNDMYRAMLGKVREGAGAPRFSAVDIRGEKFDTGAYLGKSNLVLFFYRGHWCSTCGSELKGLKEEYDRIRQQNAEVVAISTDNLDEAKNLAVDLQLPFKLISDPDHRIIDEYGVYDGENNTAFITLILIDKAGIVRYKRIVEGLEDMFSAEEVTEHLKDMD